MTSPRPSSGQLSPVNPQPDYALDEFKGYLRYNLENQPVVKLPDEAKPPQFSSFFPGRQSGMSPEQIGQWLQVRRQPLTRIIYPDPNGGEPIEINIARIGANRWLAWHVNRYSGLQLPRFFESLDDVYAFFPYYLGDLRYTDTPYRRPGATVMAGNIDTFYYDNEFPMDWYTLRKSIIEEMPYVNIDTRLNQLHSMYPRPSNATTIPTAEGLQYLDQATERTNESILQDR